MPKAKYIIVLILIILFTANVCAQETPADSELFSPAVSDDLFDIAYDISNSPQFDPQTAKQAFILLNAAIQAGPQNNAIIPEMIKVSTAFPDNFDSQTVLNLLKAYAGPYMDMEIASKAARYLIDQQNTREEREQVLKDIIISIEGKNDVFSSQLLTLLGLLMIEKVDTESASYALLNAYTKDGFNQLAYTKLAQIAPQSIGAAVPLQQFKRAIIENPYDLESVIGFAQSADSLQIYSFSWQAYDYASKLFKYLNPDQPIPDSILVQLALAYYNSKPDQHKTIALRDKLDEQGSFNLFIEAIAAHTALQMQKPDLAEQILANAEQKALALIQKDNEPGKPTPDQIAWFYSFASVKPEMAIDWANRAYSVDPNSSQKAALLAYALILNNQNELASGMIESYEQNQIMLISKALLEMEQDSQQAVTDLKLAIEKDPATLEAHHARQILLTLNSEYLTPAQTPAIESAMRDLFGEKMIPDFMPIQSRISVNLDTRDKNIKFPAQINASIIIKNNSKDILLISDNSFINGQFRIDARVTGDINRTFLKIYDKRVRPTEQIEPGNTYILPVEIDAAPLRRLLMSTPQADFDIEYTLYIDPITDDKGNVENRLQAIEPAKQIVSRSAVALSTELIQNSLDALAKGWKSQQMKTFQLFAAILREREMMLTTENKYEYLYSDWMPQLFSSAIAKGINDEEWAFRARTIAQLRYFSPDISLQQQLADRLQDPNWLVRLTALYILSQNADQSFQKVLNWTAEIEENKMVADMAIALGGQTSTQLLPQQDTENTENIENNESTEDTENTENPAQ